MDLSWSRHFRKAKVISFAQRTALQADRSRGLVETIPRSDTSHKALLSNKLQMAFSHLALMGSTTDGGRHRRKKGRRRVKRLWHNPVRRSRQAVVLPTQIPAARGPVESSQIARRSA